MKKLFALLMVCGFALAFVACDGGKAKKEAAEKAKMDSTRKADSTAQVAKAEAEAAQAKVKADSIKAAKAADSVAALTKKKK